MRSLDAEMAAGLCFSWCSTDLLTPHSMLWAI